MHLVSALHFCQSAVENRRRLPGDGCKAAVATSLPVNSVSALAYLPTMLELLTQ